MKRAAVCLLALLLIGASDASQRFYIRSIIPPLSHNQGSDQTHEEFPGTPPSPDPSPAQPPSQLLTDAWRVISAGRSMADAATRYALATGQLPAEPGHLVPVYIDEIPNISGLGDIKGNSHGHPHHLEDATFTIYGLHENLCVMVNVALGNSALLHVPEPVSGEGCDNGVYFKKHPVL